ncbi:hypothetical protein K2P56_03410 [Patescibacteria group bacterium]|nr:hypothetical protein [Patescibacteria group bacterium]
MNLKNILIGGGIILALLIGAFFALNTYIYNEKQSDTKRIELLGLVTAVDLEPMTYDGPGRIILATEDGKSYTIEVPARMNLCEAKDSIGDISTLSIGDGLEVVGDITEEGVVVPCGSMEHYLRITGIVLDRELKVRFHYRKGTQDGYVLTTPPHGNEEAADFEEAYILTQKSEYDALQAGEPGREGPPTISVLIYKNPKAQSARAWAEANPSVSNITLARGEVTDTTLNGAKGIRYDGDGLYASETLVVAHEGRVYVISGSYLDQESQIKKDFTPFLSTVGFLK